MKAWVGIAVLAVAAAGPLQAQGTAVTDATVCDIVNHPSKFDGKMVRVKGSVIASFDSFVVKGDSCTSALWLSFPAGTKAKAGPAAMISMQLASNATGTATAATRTPVTLDANKDFVLFDQLLSQKVKTPGMCLACVKNSVTATLTGRIDGSDETGLTRDSAGAVKSLSGYGNLNAYGARLVLQSVAEVSAQEIDFKSAPKIKDDGQGSNDKDYVGLTRKAEAAFPAGSPAIGQIETAVAAIGAPGQDNGVVVGFGNTGNVPAAEGGKAAKASPDGLIFYVQFDPDKLKGDALSRALVHEGSEIDSVRVKKTQDYNVIEHDAWQVVLTTTLGARQKSLMLAGGFLLYDSTWSVAERDAKTTVALQSFLQDQQTPH